MINPYLYPDDEVAAELPDRLVWVLAEGWWHTRIVPGRDAIGLAGHLPSGHPWRCAKADFS